MLVSTLAGLQASGKLERELMYSYAASYSRTLLVAAPAGCHPVYLWCAEGQCHAGLIGAIVAEFFGSPTAGSGLSHFDRGLAHEHVLVWGAIVVAAVTGSVAYALLVTVERRVAFWHPSVRSASCRIACEFSHTTNPKELFMIRFPFEQGSDGRCALAVCGMSTA
jgi:NitT/TauT family transport system permease protein